MASSTEEGRESLGPDRYKDQNRTERNGEVKAAKKLVTCSAPWIDIAARNNTKDSQFPARFWIWDTVISPGKGSFCWGKRWEKVPSFFFWLCLWWSTNQREAGRFININSWAVEPLKGACLFIESFSFKTQLPSHTRPYRVRATPRESTDLVINQLFGSLSGSGPADFFQDFLSQLFSKNVLDKADTQFSGTEEVPSVGAGGRVRAERGTHCESRFSKMLKVLAFCPSQALGEGQDSERVHLFYFSPPTLYSSPNHSWCSEMHVSLFVP